MGHAGHGPGQQGQPLAQGLVSFHRRYPFQAGIPTQGLYAQQYLEQRAAGELGLGRQLPGQDCLTLGLGFLPGGDGDAPSARISVSDRGSGVPESERERIFEPFYRPAGHSEGRDGGVGLGLALVREIARHHGGEARCLPRPGGGTIFQVDLEGC